jgi:hypothetical protein
MKYIPHMQKVIVFAGLFFLAGLCRSQSITYSFGAFAGIFAYNATPTVFPELPPGIDDGLTNPYSIGFNFDYGCQTKTQFMVSSNGWMTFNTGCIGSDPANQLAGNATQIANAERPIIAPLWDDLDVDATGNVNQKLTGSSPNRVLTIEWKKMRWKFSATGPVITFQVKLYETSNRIDFVYFQESAVVSSGSASSGLTGAANGNYYSIQSFAASPAVTNNTGEVTTLATKPASSQTYSWNPTCGLPIELILFSGESRNDKDVFWWATATEINNDFFTLEGSTDDMNYIGLKTVKATGNNRSTKHYMTELESNNYVYFRLKQNDLDKHYSYSNVIALDKDKTNSKIKVYPVPADKFLLLKNTNSYVIYDPEGKQITAGSGMEKIDTSELKEGLYFIKINDTDFYKIIIRH